MSVQQEKFKAIADKIREKTGTTEKIKPNDFVNKVEDVYQAGKSSMIDESKIIPKTVSGNPVIVRDVSEIPHDLSIQLISDTIEDFSGVEVVQTGKNLFNKNDETMIFNGYFSSEKLITASGYKTIVIPCVPNTIYKVSKMISKRFILATTDKYPENGLAISQYTTASDKSNKTITTNETAKYLVAYVYIAKEDTDITFEEIADTIQAEFGTAVTPYEPYKEYRATADSSGVVEGLKSISPKMSIYSNADVDIELTYNKSFGMDYEEKAWWDKITKNGTRTYYEYAFRDWDCEYLRPPYKIVPKVNNINKSARAFHIFSYNPSLLCVEKAYFDLSNCTTSDTTQTGGQYYTFNECRNLKYIEDIGIPAGYMYYTYANCLSLETIEMQRVNKTTIIVNAFRSCNSLKNITFSDDSQIGKSIDFQYSPLSKASITNIIEHLCEDTDVTGQTLTLKKSAVNEAFGINASDTTTWTEEWINLIKDKSNSYNGKWNISFA